MGEKTRKPWYRRGGVITGASIVVVLGLGTLFSFVSPWPSSLAIRTMFELNARQTVVVMQKYVPDSGVKERANIAYTPGGSSDTTFDLFAPTGPVTPRTTVVWIHGGAWISGDKRNVDPYVKIIASHGYTTVALNYTVAPEAQYPVALKQLNTALGYLVTHASELGIDPDSIVLAGDSAGAQYAAQLAAMATNASYAHEVGIRPALNADQLKATVLNCGIYNVAQIPSAPGIGGWGFRTALWAYFGTKDWSNTAGGKEMSTIDHVTKDFPATWISGGNDDPLTAGQSKPMAAKLNDLGVPVTPVFYPKDETPPLHHEYQFHLNDAAARSALNSTIAFLGTVSK
ncbi:alpha/beta hydrolase [Humibacter sp. RRB41]|uniref:alpha/beta hydrolase n=1 Tax=Humibacter sp. RRB41 TaxID=2919946 RepID=UPI001FA973C2|nr:alpha/beta hydrolase [Humibacter sp. RRB41]